MKLSKTQVEHIAKLSRIAITDAEAERFSEQLSAVLSYMEMLNELDTSDTEPTIQVTGIRNRLRGDEAVPCDPETRDAIMSNFPEREGEYLRVPSVFGRKT